MPLLVRRRGHCNLKNTMDKKQRLKILNEVVKTLVKKMPVSQKAKEIMETIDKLAVCKDVEIKEEETKEEETKEEEIDEKA
jgi:hypothetical protein